MVLVVKVSQDFWHVVTPSQNWTFLTAVALGLSLVANPESSPNEGSKWNKKDDDESTLAYGSAPCG